MKNLILSVILSLLTISCSLIHRVEKWDIEYNKKYQARVADELLESYYHYVIWETQNNIKSEVDSMNTVLKDFWKKHKKLK